ncbi:MAG: nitroreductase family protein [Planctomycetota bacterium]|jgi:nitroreductase
METEECIKGRRSVREFSTDPVTDEMIREIVDLTRFAPSWVNSQCVRFLVLREEKIRDELAETMSTRNPARGAVRRAPSVVVFIARESLAGYKKGEPVDDRSWHMFDTGVAVQTFCLAAHLRGCGTVIVGYFDHRKAARLLDIPPGYEVVAFTPLGFPLKRPSAPPRKSPEELLSWGFFSPDPA